MKKHVLLKLLEQFPDDADIVVQRNHGAGYFSLHEAAFIPGHVAWSGPIITAGEQIPDVTVISKQKLTIHPPEFDDEMPS